MTQATRFNHVLHIVRKQLKALEPLRSEIKNNDDGGALAVALESLKLLDQRIEAAHQKKLKERWSEIAKQAQAAAGGAS